MDFKARYTFDINKDLLGKGEASRVYRAYDTLLERVVALKFFSANASEKFQVLDEIKKAILFEHPSLCKYFDAEVLTSHNIIGEQEHIQVGIMEYLDGGNLKQFAAAHPQYFDKLLVDVLNGLSYLHKRGIVLRDLKPHNILIKMVDNEPVAKITNFRYSEWITENEEKLVATPGAAGCTAPEQLNPEKYGTGGKIATNLDMWCFGLFLYETLQAAPLFGRSAGVSAGQFMDHMLNDEYGAKLETVAPKYRKILKLCLVKEASKRVGNAADLIPLLETPRPSGQHVFVSQQTTAPKIVDHTDVKTAADPKKVTDKAPEISLSAAQKEPELDVPEHPFVQDRQADNTPPPIQRPQHPENTNGLKQAAAADLDDARQDTAAQNRLAGEANFQNTLPGRPGHTNQRADTDKAWPQTAKKETQPPAEAMRTAVKPGNATFNKIKPPVTNRQVKTATRSRDEKSGASWKSRVIGLLLVVVFTVLILWQQDDDSAAVQAGNKQASGSAQPSGAMLPQMAAIPGSVFLMGFDGKEATDAEKPVHPVLVNDFSIGKYEVTIGEFRNFVAQTGYQTTAEQDGGSFIYDAGGKSQKAAVNWRYDINGILVDSAQANLPVVHVSWYDAVAYCDWLSEKEGKKYRLPTEAEWEYAVLGGKQGHFFTFNSSDTLSTISWNGANSENKYHEVGGKTPNALGLYDMIGNVYEWCADWYDAEAYRSGKAENPAGPKTGGKKVIRGGSWYPDGGPEYYRPTIRFVLDPKERGAKVGFRVCVSSGK